MSKIRQINEIGTGISLLLKNDRNLKKKTFKNSIMFIPPTNIVNVTTEMSCFFFYIFIGMKL